MIELIVKWAMQEYEALKSFPFTTLTINGCLKTKMHRDGINAGASFIIGLGDYKEGDYYTGHKTIVSAH